jgi:hypothetical protein
MIRFLAFISGLAVVSAATYWNVMIAGGFQSEGAPLIVAVAFLVLVGAAIVGYGYANGGWLYATGLLFAIVVGEIYWAAMNTERELQAMLRDAAPIVQATEAHAAAEKRVADAEIAKRAADAAAISKAAEKGCALNCRTLLGNTQAAADRELVAARVALDAAPRPQARSALADELGMRPQRLALILAIFRSITVLGGSLAVGLALHGKRKVAETPKTVVEVSHKMADVAAFAAECLSPALGASVESKRLWLAYCQHAQQKGLSALPRGQFDEALVALCKAAELTMQQGKVLGVKLAA